MATPTVRFRVAPVTDYVRSSLDELRKVIWPTREQATRYTVTVIVSVLIVTALTAGLDYSLAQGLERLIQWSQRV